MAESPETVPAVRSVTGGHGAAVRHFPVWVQAVAAAGISGGLMACCFRPLNLHWLAWVAMVPWLVMLPRLEAGKAWLIGGLVGLLYYRLGLGWAFGISGPLAGGVILVFAIWMGFAFRVAGMVIRRFGPAAMLWALPLAYVGHEVIRCEALPRLRIPFLALGYSQAGNLWIAQIASLGGVYVLSGLIVAANTAIAYAILRRTRRAWWPVVAIVVMMASLGLVAQPAVDVDSPRLAVACVQGENLSMVRYVELTRQALSDSCRPRLVVLPEHTIEALADEHESTTGRLAQLAREYQACICVGAHARPARGAACDYDNVGLVIGPDGTIAGKQAKSVPLPFFIDGNPAQSLAPVDTPLGKLGVCVCYDALFTDVPRRLVAQGAQVLVVPVMDPERWPDQERLQHADMAPFRCIELRRCAVRAASAGVSQIVDATGRVVADQPKTDRPELLFGAIGMHHQRTVFARGGYLVAPTVAGAFLIVVGLLTVAEWTPRRKRL